GSRRNGALPAGSGGGDGPAASLLSDEDSRSGLLFPARSSRVSLRGALGADPSARPSSGPGGRGRGPARALYRAGAGRARTGGGSRSRGGRRRGPRLPGPRRDDGPPAPPRRPDGPGRGPRRALLRSRPADDEPRALVPGVPLPAVPAPGSRGDAFRRPRRSAGGPARVGGRRRGEPRRSVVAPFAGKGRALLSLPGAVGDRGAPRAVLFHLDDRRHALQPGGDRAPVPPAG